MNIMKELVRFTVSSAALSTVFLATVFLATVLLATVFLAAATVANAETPIDNTVCAANANLPESHTQPLPTTRDMRALHTLYASLSGRWHGEVREVVCIGRGHTLRDQWRYFQVSDANAVVSDDGRLRLVATKERLDVRHGHPTGKVVSVTPHAKTDYYPAWQLSKVDVVNNQQITTQVQYRQSNRLVSATSVTGASSNLTNVRTREDTLTLTGDHLSITTHWYTNGTYSGTEFTELTRR